jgi:hypothetical protein
MAVPRPPGKLRPYVAWLIGGREDRPQPVAEIPASETGSRLFAITIGLEVVALVFLMHGAAIRFWNYALYAGAIAAGVLILVDLPQPSNYAAEGYRLLWTLCGAGIAVLVMLLAGMLARRTAKTPQQATQPA